MRELALTRAAERDLERIAVESETGWGVNQRDRYLAEMKVRMWRLLERPELGPPARDRSDLRRLIVGRHAVFYEFDDALVRIIRIIHQHMDAPRHLGRGAE